MHAPKPTRKVVPKQPRLVPRLAPSRRHVDRESIVRELIERGFNRGDLSVLDEVLDPDFVEHEVIAPGIPHNREAVRAIIQSLRTGFPDLRLTIETLDVIKDRVWVRMRANGTHRGPFMGSPPTGRRMSVNVLDLVLFKGNRIKAHWGIPDNLSAMEQLGLLPID
jgi:predicted ester cyclase